MQRSVTSIVLVVLGLLPGLSLAATTAAPARGPWVSVFGSWNSYGMDGANSRIGILDDFVSSRFGAHMPSIHSAYGLGAQIGTDRRRVAFGVGFDRYFATSEVSVRPQEGLSSGLKYEFKLPANAWYGFANFRLPAAGPLTPQLGLAAGVVTLAPMAITASSRATGGTVYASRLTGAGPMFEADLSSDLRIASAYGLFVSAGYRSAKVVKPRISGTWHVPQFPVDYSGATFRAGLKLHLRK